MSRILRLATVLLACVSVASACTLDSGAYPDQTGGGATGGVAGSGAGGAMTGGTGTGGVSPLCGNGTKDPGEECDEGGKNADTGTCTTHCKLPTCGDASVQPSNDEACDLGMGKNADTGTCTTHCKLPMCGDTFVQPSNDEECDLGTGNNADDAACTSKCKNAKCGDGLIETKMDAEQCDDQNTADGDGCSKDCKIEPGWMCTSMPAMLPQSTCTPVCGDGMVVGAEECDDGNSNDKDWCSSACKLEGTCGDGVVGPGEVCDGGADCKMMCKQIDPTKTCGKIKPITPMPAGADGVVFTEITGDTTVMSFGKGDTAPPPPTCDNAASDPTQILMYTTGKRGSIVTVETKPGDMTFDDTVVWIFRDCVGKSDLEACDDEGGQDSYSKATTGYLPPQTTLFIAVAGGSAGEKGKFVLDVTEQPVTLLLGVTLNTGNLGGLLSNAQGGMGKWEFCDGGAGCGGPNSTGSWSGKGYAVANDNPDTSWNKATLQTPSITLKGLAHMSAQYDIDFNVTGGGNPTFTFQEKVGDGQWSDVAGTTQNGGNFADTRHKVDVSADVKGASKLAVGFTFDDGNTNKAGFAKIDDLWVYGY